MNEYAENLLVHFRRIESLRAEALEMPSVDLNTRQLGDLELLLNRAYFPLGGYLRRENHESVLRTMRLTDGTLWPMPVCLDVPTETARRLSSGSRLALRDPEGFMLAVLTVAETWQPDLEAEARALFGTADPEAHSGVARFLAETASWYVGGKVEGLHLPPHPDFRDLRHTPADMHRRFADYGWRNVMGVHAEGFLHRARREAIFAAARQAGANIFLHPAVDLKHPGDAGHFSQVVASMEFARKFPKNMIMLGILPLPSRAAGPREALFQAVVRRNFGCSHFAVDPDHADPTADREGAEPFYALGEAQRLVATHETEIGIRMVPLEPVAYVEERAQYLPVSAVTEGMTVKDISSLELIRRLENGLDVPPWFSYPEVVAELQRIHPPRSRQGFTVFMTGLSGSGKSTLAKVLMVKFMEMRGRPVTLLDGDIVRRNLSSELNFSKAHRNLNITRIGFVASEITKNGGIAICAPIAPYDESRRQNRDLISRYGGYIEVHVSTPIEICEQRDRKGLYAKARAGIVKGVTGVSDPYEEPGNPELRIDTSRMSPEEAAQEVLLYLSEEGYIG